MIAEIGAALLVAGIGTMAIGTVVKGKLGFRSAVNWAVQTAVLGAIAFVAPWPTELQAWTIVLFPTFIHLLVHVLKRIVRWRTKHGAYGEPAMWAYELFQEGDEEFIRAQSALSKQDVMEAKVIADSKEQLRNVVIQRYESKRNL